MPLFTHRYGSFRLGPLWPLPLGSALAACLALLSGGCGEEPAPPRPLRVRLLDHVAEAEREGFPEAVAQPEPERVRFDFDARLPAPLLFGRARERGVDYEVEQAAIGAVDPEGGLEGGCLRLGPGLPEDGSRAVIAFPTTGLTRVRVTGRVRLEGNPLAGEASSREVLRVIERRRGLEDPERFHRWSRQRTPGLRVSRQLDPSGWDRFELELVTAPATRALELQLLHRSGASEAAVTRFDELVVEEARMSPGEALAHVAARYRPRDGRADDNPWRLRVDLPARGGMETRDALLLPPPARLSFPVRLPEAETRPRLRFHYGMLAEAFRVEGDGARIAVSFRGRDGTEVALGEVQLDPKNEREHRRWLAARLELDAVAGRDGWLVFAASDVPDSEPDPLDALVLATPRIEPAVGAPRAANVLLIGVDTLRADRMSAFGYEHPTTPNLARLADEGVRFPRARSQAPWTLPSFSSILTSMYPSAHGAGRGGHDEWTPIDPTTVSLAEVLARVGYETYGLVANFLVSPRYGLDQGFEAYRGGMAMESAERDAESVAEWVASHETTPWLVFWHVMDPHLPYSTPDTYRERFTEPGYAGRFAKGRRPAVPFEVLDPRPGRRWFAHEGPPTPPELDEEDRRFVHGYYEAELAEMDAAVGVVLDALRESGQWERTIVAFVADHGEGLGDHGHYHHGYTLFEDQVHVPLILRVPGRHEGLVLERSVAAIDLAPTVLGALGLAPPELFQGVDRLAPDASTDDAYFIECPTYDSSAQKAWVLGDFKYLHDPVFHTEALYHLEADPAETRDVAGEHPEVVARARAELDAFRWEQLQKGRFHLRVRGAEGQRLRVALETDDLFDANFACRPMRPEHDFALDLERRQLVLDTELAGGRLELVFWCRGTLLGLDVALDGETVRDVDLGGEEDLVELPAEVALDSVPSALGAELAWPDPGRAELWLEAGVVPVAPVILTPQEIETLQKLGYTR